MIEVRSVYKRFGEKQVLGGVSLDVQDNETLVILGKSGGGKSVLLKMLIGLMMPDTGSITMDGKDVVRMEYEDLRELRWNVGFLFQGAALFDSRTVGENVALALQRKGLSRGEVQERVHEALKVVGLADAEKLMPAALSGGMRKRVGLARAIVPRPRYILYDEPTTGLDVETADGINRLIRELKDTFGVTSIVVTHDLHSAFFIGDRFAILNKGTILTSGTQDDLQNSRDDEVQKYINSSLPTTKAYRV